MKARHIRKIRKKLKDKSFLHRQLKKWAQEDDNLNHFYKFECSDFFRGKETAEINRQEYNKRSDICYRKLIQIKRLLQSAN